MAIPGIHPWPGHFHMPVSGAKKNQRKFPAFKSNKGIGVKKWKIIIPKSLSIVLLPPCFQQIYRFQENRLTKAGCHSISFSAECDIISPFHFKHCENSIFQPQKAQILIPFCKDFIIATVNSNLINTQRRYWVGCCNSHTQKRTQTKQSWGTNCPQSPNTQLSIHWSCMIL